MNAGVPAVLDAVPRVLASDAARERVRCVAIALPSSTGGILECHLGHPDRVDVAVRLDPAGRATYGVPDGVRAWVECDAGSTGEYGLFAGVGSLPHGVRPSCPDADGWLRLAALVRAEPLGAAAAARLRVILDRVPHGAWPSWVGALPGRDGDVRLTVAGLTRATVGTYLAAVGVARETRDAAVALAADVPVVVHLDVGSALGDDVGVEVPASSPRRVARLAARLLAEAGTDATPADALARWPGVTVADGLRIVRRVSHLKVVLRASAPPRQKAYLYYGDLGVAA